MSQKQDHSAFPLFMHGEYGKGMTLRDYFAAAALTGIRASNDAAWSEHFKIAECAYQQADAMLAVRKEEL